MNKSTLNYTYDLYENESKIYSSNDINFVIHELLSILFNYLSFQNINNLQHKNIFNNLYINVILTEIGKRYPINITNIIFNMETFSLSATNSLFTFILEDYNFILIDKIKSFKKNNIKVNKLKSLDEQELECQKAKREIINEPVSINTFIENTKNILKNEIKLDDTSYCAIPKEVNIETEYDENKIMEQINIIENMKKQEEDKILEIKNKYNQNKDDLLNYESEIKGEKMKERLKKDNEQQQKRIFESDKNSYNLMKKDIEQGKLNEDKISVFFKQKYPIFKFMEENNDLDSENDFEIYNELFNDLYGSDTDDDNDNDNDDDNDKKNQYIPHNYHYMSEKDKEKYKCFIDNNKKNKMPSLDDLMMELNELEKEELINNSGIDCQNEKTSESNDENSITEIKKIFENNFN